MMNMIKILIWINHLEIKQKAIMPIFRFLQKKYINMMQTCNLNSPMHSSHFSKNFDIKFINFGQTELKI